MPLTKESKQDIIGRHKLHEKDSGSPEVQIALLTERITELTGHMKTHLKDNRSQRALVEMVSMRQRHLNYLKRTSLARYQGLVDKLGLRK